MAQLKCDICGEVYSDTYHVCPFCEEEEAIRAGRPIRRRAKDFRNKKGGHAIGVLAMLLAAIVIGGTAVWVFGEDIAERFGLRQMPVSDSDGGEGVQEYEGVGATGQEGGNTGDSGLTTPPDSGDGTQMPEGDGQGADGGQGSSGGQTGEVVTQPVMPPTTPVQLNSTDVTMVLNETAVLKATGGSGTYTWTSGDTSKVVVVDGKVTIVGRDSKQANVKVTVSDGFTQAECIVRVKGGTPVNVSGSGEGNGSGSQGGNTTAPAELKLSRTDMTLSKGETWQLKVSGTNSQVTWSIGDSSIASLTENGTVKGLRSGNTTVTAKVDGQTLKCIVRVK